MMMENIQEVIILSVLYFFFTFKEREVWLQTVRWTQPFIKCPQIKLPPDKRNPYLEQAVIPNSLKVIRPLCPTAEISSA